jgi:hypothetical protein
MKTKNLITGLALGLTLLASCEKEPIQEVEYTTSDCKCGDISNDGISYEGDYFITVRNYCTGSTKKVVLDADRWIDAHIGEMRCYSSQW